MAIDLYRIAVMQINELTKDDRPTAAVRVDLEALKALIDVLIAKLPEEDSTLCDDCLISGRSRCYHNQPKEEIDANTQNK